jgi:hypothetical protein
MSSFLLECRRGPLQRLLPFRLKIKETQKKFCGQALYAFLVHLMIISKVQIILQTNYRMINK